MGIGILDEVKSVAKTIQKINNIELYQKILNLQGDIMQLLEENSTLKTENSSLKHKLSIKESLKFENDVYWMEKSKGVKEGPFCSCCWDTKQQLVRMLVCGNPDYSNCPICKVAIKLHNKYRKEPLQRKTGGVYGTDNI